VVATVLNYVVRLGVGGYAEAEPRMQFTLGMLWARLAVAAASSLLAGAVAAWVGRSPWRASLITGVIGLVLFVPEHVKLWHVFPAWYHLSFLLTLLPLMMLGGRLAQPGERATA
jgi:hypothetical protein